MHDRRTVVVAALLLAAVAPPAGAKAPYVLDGIDKVHLRITETLRTAAVRPNTVPTNVLTVEPSDCETQVRSCVIVPLRLTLPKDRSAGVFTITAAAPRGVNLVVALYDAAGARLRQSDVVNDRNCCWAVQGTVVYRIAYDYLRHVGRYQVIVYDRGAAGVVTLDVDWHAHPRDRPTYSE